MSKPKRAKRKTPIETLMELPPAVELVAYLAQHAGEFDLSPADHRRAVIADKLKGSDLARALDMALKVREAIAQRPSQPKAKAKPFKVELKPEDGDESIVETLARDARAMGLPDEDQRRLWEAAELYRDATRGWQGTEQRALALSVAKEIQDRIAAEIGETVTLEQARSTSQVRRLAGNRTQLCGRDGLILAYDKGALTGLTEKEREANPVRAIEAWTAANVRMQGGLGYREHYETVCCGLRSQFDSIGNVGGSAASGADAAHAHARAALTVVMIERKIATLFPSGRPLTALRLIAGEGHTARSLGSGGRMAECTTRALIQALDIAARHLKIPGSALLTR